MACIGPWGDASKQTGHEVCATIVKLAGAMDSTACLATPIFYHDLDYS